MTSRAAARSALKERPTFTFEEFLEPTMDQHAEWVEGEIVPMAAVTIEQTQITRFLMTLFTEFVERQQLGEIMFDPFVMKTGPAEIEAR